MITSNQRMGPRKSFTTHHRSTTSKNKTEIRKTDDGIDLSTTKKKKQKQVQPKPKIAMTRKECEK